METQQWCHLQEGTEQKVLFEEAYNMAFKVFSKMMQIFYKYVVESVISSAIIWGSSIRARDLKWLINLMKNACSVLGTTVEQLEIMMKRRILHKNKRNMDNSEHPLHETILQLLSVFNRRLLQFRCSTDCYRKNFLSAAIMVYNNFLKNELVMSYNNT